jgi:hypothetical protein
MEAAPPAAALDVGFGGEPLVWLLGGWTVTDLDGLGDVTAGAVA